MVTRRDVAELAGVSPATVSYYINGKNYVSKETGEKIARAIETLGYRPNLIAKSLKSKDTRQLVFLCNEIRNPFHAQVAYDVTNIAYEHGYTMLFCNVIDDVEYINRLCGYQVSGFFIATSKISVKAINSIAEKNIPVVFLTDMVKPEIDTRVSRIIIDYSYVMDELIKVMKRKGVKSICYISSALDGEDGKTESVKNAVGRENVSLKILYGIASAKSAYEEFVKNFKNTELPHGCVCANDAVAAGVLRAAYDMGYRCPEDILIAGIDNTIDSDISIPSITTIDNRKEEISKKAIEMLLKKIREEEVSDYVIRTTVRYKESTGK